MLHFVPDHNIQYVHKTYSEIICVLKCFKIYDSLLFIRTTSLKSPSESWFLILHSNSWHTHIYIHTPSHMPHNTLLNTTNPRHNTTCDHDKWWIYIRIGKWIGMHWQICCRLDPIVCWKRQLICQTTCLLETKYICASKRQKSCIFGYKWWRREKKHDAFIFTKINNRFCFLFAFTLFCLFHFNFWIFS